jgi:hypothetical protein
LGLTYYFLYTNVTGVTYTAVELAATAAKNTVAGACPETPTCIKSVLPGAIQLSTSVTAVGAVASVLKNTGTEELVFTTLKTVGPLLPPTPVLAPAGVILPPLDELVAVISIVGPATMYAVILLDFL